MGAGSSFINSQHLLWQESPSPTPGAPNIPPESFQGQSPGSKLNCGCFPLCMVCRASLVALREHLEIKKGTGANETGGAALLGVAAPTRGENTVAL